MDDLVHRVRVLAETASISSEDYRLLNKAADRIEQLERQVRQLSAAPFDSSIAHGSDW